MVGKNVTNRREFIILRIDGRSKAVTVMVITGKMTKKIIGIVLPTGSLGILTLITSSYSFCGFINEGIKI